MKGSAHTYELTEKYQPNRQLLLALQRLIVSFSSLFSCVSSNFSIWITLTALIALFLAAAGSHLQQKALKKNPTVHYLFSTKQQTDS